MLRLLEELVARDKFKDRMLEDLHVQNRTLQADLIKDEDHCAGTMSSPDAGDASPTRDIDAFDGNRLPFHLDFISSFEMLFAVFMEHFKYKGDFALERIRRHLFVLLEVSKPKQIDFGGLWDKAFRVIYSRVLLRPGEAC